MTDTSGLPSLAIEGRVATITFQRPDVANRLGPDDLDEIHRHIETVNASEALVLRIRGTGKYFCSGFDIGKLAAGQRGSGFEELVNTVEDCRPVTIAALNGGVYGGGTDLALACDFRVGVPTTDMFMPAARLGLHFYKRGMERYVTRLGLDTAKRLFLTAARLQSDELLRCGFLTSLVDAADLDANVDALSETVASMAPLAVLGMKKHLNRIARGVLDVEELAVDVARAAQSADIKEGALAWKEKRKPRFQGN
ncbi:enoyl-CoA hydratase [Cupriavidus sp. HMR-1]|uniref:enoyl-CoA hydratase/isomerase family protein n=1 Tax=Cupriavidus sp. HMR-1 TaxID=1249621 RepID=UPI0002A27D76|nr:enoyl-CoA hydratase/isomerase family protein [Cupriavidus sp. HMR-1]EKZ99582.1 enoyl-CoA hydratase [Cupriavidus sp. HMR-1]